MTRLRKTKILCTIGPATRKPDVVRELIKSGMNVARLNFSHGDHDYHRETYEIIREQSRLLGQRVAILQDLSGPKIRLGDMEENTFIETGDTMVFQGHEPIVGNCHRAFISYPKLYAEISVGERILVDDGLVEFVVESIDDKDLTVRALVGGELKSKKGVNLPGVQLSVPALTEKDHKDLAFGLELGVDLVALSFVRHPEDFIPVRQIMAKHGCRKPLIAKIEKVEALNELDDIVSFSDGIMVARGDLGVEAPLEDVPVIQKRLVRMCLEHSKPVIIATQMLESMVDSARPTRAEVSDVANSILDGTDAVMLSAETAVGRYPIRTVQVMDKIARRSELAFNHKLFEESILPTENPIEAVAKAACRVADQVQARAIVACSHSGRTVRIIARNRPKARILGLTSQPNIVQELQLSWGVTPVLVPAYSTTDELMDLAVKAAKEEGNLPPGSLVVIVAGIPIGNPTNLIRLKHLD